MNKKDVARLLDAGRDVCSKVDTILTSIFPELAVSEFTSPFSPSRFSCSTLEICSVLWLQCESHACISWDIDGPIH
jgi:hypothetical protein